MLKPGNKHLSQKKIQFTSKNTGSISFFKALLKPGLVNGAVIDNEIKNSYFPMPDKRDYDALINCSDDHFWSVTIDFKLVAANHAFIKSIEDSACITLTPGDNLLTVTVFPDVFLAFLKSCYLRALSGETIHEEFFIPAFKKTKARWVGARFNPIFTNGQISGIACHARDISEKKITEEKIKQNEIRLAESQALAKIGSWETDLVNFNVIWSLETYRIFEIDPNSFKASHRRFLEFVHPDEREKVDAAFVNSLKSDTVNSFQHRILTAGGQIKMVEERWRIFHDNDGKPARAVGTCQDITERMSTAGKIKETEVRYHSLIEQATDAICITDPSMNIIDINPSGCQMLGYNKEEFLQLTIADLFVADDLKKDPFRIDQLKSGKVISNERRFKRKDGSLVEVEINARILKDGKFVVFARDITERKQAENALQAAYNEKNIILESIDDGFFAIDNNSLVTYWNRKAEELLGEKREAVIGRNLHEMFARPDSQIFYENYQKAISENATVHFEGFSTRSNKWFAVSAFASGNGLSVHFKDVTERKAFEEKIKVSEIRYRSLIEQATDAICIADASLRFIDINPYACDILGYTIEEALQLRVSDIVFAEDLVANPFKFKEVESGKIIRNERRFKRKDGTAIVMEVSTKLLEDGKFIMYGHDISERKAAECRLKESELRYRTLIEQASDTICIIDASLKFIEINSSGCALFGYSKDETLELYINDILFNDDLKTNPIKIDELMAGKTINNERRIKRKDGTQVEVELNGKMLDDGRIIIFGRDITERKLAAQRLKESNQRYNLISRATNDMVWDWDLVTGKVYRNKEGWKKIFKTGDREIDIDLIGDWNERIHPEDQETVKRVAEEIKTSKKDFFEVECRVIRDDGTYAYIHDRANIIRNGRGEAVRLIGATQDITQRKEAEFQVAKSEMHFRSLVQNSSDLTGILNDRGYFLYCSLAVKKILGYDPEFMLDKNAFAFVHPDDVGALKAHMSKKENINYINATRFRFKNAAGDWRWLESKVTDMSNDPEVRGYIFNARDITERKIAEAEIEKLSFIARETSNAVVITDADGEIVWVNAAFTRITEYEFDEALGRKPGDFLQGKETSLAAVRFMRNKIKLAEPFECDILNYSKSGEKYWLRILCQPQFDETGKLKHFFAIETDVSKEKEAEEILKTSEERYRYLFNNNPASIIIWDIKNFEILEINDTAMNTYGYSRKEFLSKTVLDLRHPEFHNNIKEFAAMAGQKHDFISVNTWKHLSKSGKEMYMNIASHRIRFKSREVILSLSTNITEKIFLEKQLENERLIKQQEITEAVISAQEEERQELGSELHDNINQILAGSRLYLGLAKKELQIEHPYLTETETLINSAITEIRNLSHSLIPPSLHESQLLGAINNIIEVTQKTSGIIINLQAYGFDETKVCDKLKLSIYRIIQEQFNNILKHADAQKVIVRLLQERGKTVLIIKDDGAGFDTGKKAKGVGLMNIKTRASLFNGEMTVLSAPGNGCELNVVFN